MTCNCGAVLRDHNDVIEFNCCNKDLMFQNTHPTPLQVKLRSKKCLRPGIHLAKKFNGGNNDYTVILRELNFSIEGLSVFKFKHTLIQKWRGFFYPLDHENSFWSLLQCNACFINIIKVFSSLISRNFGHVILFKLPFTSPLTFSFRCDMSLTKAWKQFGKKEG